MKRKVTAVWKGTGAEGSGTLTGQSGLLKETPYSAKLRFQNEEGTEGTNPEELIAAAHAGCFAMALSFGLSREGYTPERLEAKATVQLDKLEGGFEITGITLDLHGVVPGIDEATFIQMAEGAKAGCPVSKALKAVPISLNVTFG
ncbi:MAG: OsmC family protein [Saprospiraceae bacterium]|nr:OsmC family protein [Saprospiraceae bacterium]